MPEPEHTSHWCPSGNVPSKCLSTLPFDKLKANSTSKPSVLLTRISFTPLRSGQTGMDPIFLWLPFRSAVAS